MAGDGARNPFTLTGWDSFVRPETIALHGGYKTDPVNVSALGQNNAEAVRVMDRAGWR